MPSGPSLPSWPWSHGFARLRTDPGTRAYADRRRGQGKTNREIKRCLVRYVARQLYRLLETQPALDPT